MRILSFLYLSSSSLIFAQEANQDNESANTLGVDSALFDSSFFSGVLDQANESDDAMGTQRLIDTRNSAFSPSISFTTTYQYNSNPEAVPRTSINEADAFSMILDLGFAVGLGEFGIGDDVLLTPSISTNLSRSFYDFPKDFGGPQINFKDTDLFSASVSLPFSLPNDFVLNISHAYMKIMRVDISEEILSINKPSLSFSKNYIFDNGSILTPSFGISYNFNETPPYTEMLLMQPGVPSNLIETILDLYKFQNINPNTQFPTDAGNSLENILGLTYSYPLNEKLSVVPSINYVSSNFTKSDSRPRTDSVFMSNLLLSYSFSEWLNISANSSYIFKRTNSGGEALGVNHYENFSSFMNFGINYAF